VAVGVLIKTLLIEETVEKDVTQYEYNVEQNLQYQVHIINNKIYSENILGEGLNYPKKLVDYIKVDYGLNYIGTEEVPVNIEYQTFAKVSGFLVEDEVKTVYWTKEFPLSQAKTVEKTQSEFELTDSIKSPMAEFETFAIDSEEITGLILSYEVTFCLEGKLIADTPYGKLEKPIEMTVAAPLTKEAFTLEKGNLENITDKITTKVTETLPINKNIVFLCSLIAFICLLSFLYLLIFTINYDLKDTLISIMKKIIKNYGSRMVELHSDVMKTYQYQFDVRSMKDLIKVSDELQKPIYYEVDEEDIVKDFKFCVQNGNDLYTYNAMDSIIESEG
jgi:hypothetical protein